MPFRDLYAVLGLSRSADTAEVRQAYLASARRTHPDKAGGGPQRSDEMDLIYKAWQVCLWSPPAGTHALNQHSINHISVV